MTYATGIWGVQAKARSNKRLAYFRNAQRGFRKGNHLKLMGERLVPKILKGAKYVDKPSHDFEWEGKTIEVKAANKHKSDTWYFHITNQLQLKSDYFLLILLDDNKYITSYLVPSEEITAKTTIRCNGSRYAEYEI